MNSVDLENLTINISTSPLTPTRQNNDQSFLSINTHETAGDHVPSHPLLDPPNLPLKEHNISCTVSFFLFFSFLFLFLLPLFFLLLRKKNCQIALMNSFYLYNRETHKQNKVILAHYFYWFTICATIIHKHYQILIYNSHNHKRII